MNEFVLNGLVKRRAELAGDIENTHEAGLSGAIRGRGSTCCGKSPEFRGHYPS
jgi:hypothetical protein